MSNMLEQSLRRFASDLDTESGPISVAEIVAAAEAEHTGKSDHSWSRWLLVAASVAVAAGLTFALTRAGGTPSFDPANVPPVADDLPATGTSLTPEEQLIMSMATEALLSECMTAAGFTYISPTDAEQITQFGSWQPHPTLGLRRAGAAERIGYQDAGGGGLGSPTQAAAFRSMTEEERDAFFEALTNAGDSDAHHLEILQPDGQPTGVSAPDEAGTCWGEVEAQTPHGPDTVYGYDWLITNRAESAGVGETVAADERVVAALNVWRTCMLDQAPAADSALVHTLDPATATPNLLAREFAVASSGDPDGVGAAAPTDLEIAVAVADADCQAQAELQTTWAVVTAEVTRFHLADDVGYYDELTLMQQENLAWASTVLATRGLVPPALD